MSAALDALVANGAIVFVALALIAAETLALLSVAARRPWLSRRSIVANGLSGAFLLLALQAALADAGSARIALWLSLGLVAHLSDLAARLAKP